MPTNARPDSPSRPDLEGLKVLLSRATPGPWVSANLANVTTKFVRTAPNATCETTAYRPADDALATAAVNALPSLIAHVERLESIVGEMLDKFDTFDGQPFVNPPDNVWARARAALSQGTSHE